MQRWLLLLALGLAGCAPPPSVTPTARLLPLPVAAATSTLPLPAATPILVASPTPPPPPVTHVVQAGETLIGLAVRYGVSLEALQQANPDVQPEALSVGAVLLLPLGDEAEGVRRALAAAQPTPMPFDLSAPACASAVTGALFCFVEAHNPGAVALEAAAARLVLAGADGLPLTEAIAAPGLDLLRPGGTLPLVAVFASPPPPGKIAAVGASPAAAYPLEDVGARYVRLEAVVEAGGPSGAAWRATGRVRNVDERAAQVARVLLVLYDEVGAVIGFRQAALDAGLASGESAPFDLTAAAPGGGAVVRAAVLAEGRP